MYKGIFLNSKDGFSDNEISESILQKFEAQIVKKKNPCDWHCNTNFPHASRTLLTLIVLMDKRDHYNQIRSFCAILMN